MINSKIAGVGYYVPEKVVTNDDLASYLDTSDEWITRKIGIKERRVAADNEVTSDMGAAAAEMVLKNAGVKSSEIDLIILAANLPDHISPATAVKVQEKIGASNAFGFDIRTGGCPGLVYGITIASKFIADGSCKNVLIVASDMNSKGVDWSERLTAVILGDGASAVVLQASDKPGIIDSKLCTDPSGYYGAYVPAGGTVEPITVQSLRDHRQYFKMDGKAIFDFATTAFPSIVTELLERNGMTIDDIDYIIPHQANINIINESMKKLGTTLEKTYCNIDKYGNTGGSSVGIALGEAMEKGIIRKGHKIILVSFGAGLCWGAILLEV